MKENIKALNGLKIPFALMIVMTHYQGNLCWAKSPITCLNFFFNYGSLGVEFFFILSGFLIAYNYKDRICDMTFQEFWIGRIKKLLPYYIYGVVIDISIFIVDQFVLKTDVFKYSTLKLNLFNLVTSFVIPLRSAININVFNGVLWFMCDLSIAYALYYVISNISKRYSGSYIVMISFIAIISLDGMHRECDYFVFSEHIFRAFSCFFSGLLLFEIYSWIVKLKTIDMTKIGYAMLCSILLLAILTVIFSAEQILGEDRLHVRMSFIIFIIPAMIISVINVPLLNKVLSTHCIQKIASFTTALYVSHADVIHLCHMLQIYFKINVSYLDAKVFCAIFGCCLTFALFSENLIAKAIKRVKCQGGGERNRLPGQ